MVAWSHIILLTSLVICIYCLLEITIRKLIIFTSQHIFQLCSSLACLLHSVVRFKLLSPPLPLAACRCRTFRPDHHAWARERCGLHHALHGLFRGRSSAQGRTHRGHVRLPGTLRPVAVGVHRGHCAPRWHPGVLAELAQPTSAAHGIRVFDDALQFHVVRVRLLRTARWERNGRE